VNEEDYVDNVMVNASVCVYLWICTAKRDGDLLEILGLETYIPCRIRSIYIKHLFTYLNIYVHLP
jgi:hypothetical protein